MGKPKPYSWVCETCGSVFKTRRLLLLHYEDNQGHHIKKSCATHKGVYYCKYCGEFHDQLNGLHLHEKCCKMNPNRVDGTNKGVKMSDEFRKMRSNSMKIRHKNGTAPTLSQLRGREKPSYPEKWLIKVIKNEGIDNNYVREQRFHTFSLDFYWPNKKKVIEMDGRFHKISEYQIDCDKRKDALLKEEGYEEMRIDWEYCFRHPKEIIEKIKKFIGE